MVKRIIKASKSHSFFLFDARGTGKSTFVREHFYNQQDTLWIDLLRAQELDLLSDKPWALKELIAAKPDCQRVVVDEIQRVPELLDVVHELSMMEKKYHFVLTGSSARKLKRTGVNLLAGRAFQYFCHPLVMMELGEKFNLSQTLQFGSLPGILPLVDEEKKDFLRAYIETYFKEEIVAEQIVRNLKPFKNFLHVAAQMNGQILNINKIAKDVDIDNVTVQNYFEVLEETLVGFILEPFNESIRKRQRQSSKFYYFDVGICRALKKLIDIPLTPQTSDYGDAFEHFCILEIKRIKDYKKPDWTLSYLRTKENVEIDLIIERPGRPRALIEFKSTDSVKNLDENKLRSYLKLTHEIPNSETFIISNDPMELKREHCSFIPYWKMIDKLGFNESP